MSLGAHAKLGEYEIVGLLGVGGMGEVYRARDLKLKREVAIKVLPHAFAADAERAARFKREAEILASLNHPGISMIHDVARHDGLQFLVLELVDGETLADRLARGRLPVDEALSIARDIADALGAAHEKGIVHRDLKPANVKITAAGTVKVLDFGLAKVHDAATAGTSGDALTVSVSQPGAIVGTAAYMSPEQARGVSTDRTADTWALGCVLFEMLAGARPHQGETLSDVVAAIIKTEPDWRLLPQDTPEGIRRLLRRCLQKERKQRFQDIGDVRIEIEEAQAASADSLRVARFRLGNRRPMAWALGLLVLAAAGTTVALQWPRGSSPQMVFDVVTPETTDPVSMAVSPDGRVIAFVATADGRPQLWVRAVDTGRARKLADTDFASMPFWAPDGHSIGFFAEGKLKRIDVTDGSLKELANAPNPRGGAWNPDGIIIFAPSGGRELFRVDAASGGQATRLTRLETGHGSHRYPHFLPDGSHFLYYVQGSRDVSGTYVSDLAGGNTRRLLTSDGSAVYADGHLFFVRGTMLLAQRFDPRDHDLSGDPIAVSENITVDNEDVAALSASSAGPIIYRSGALRRLRQLAWFDRSGRKLADVGEPLAGPLNPALSPDGRFIALFRQLSGQIDVWTLEIERGLLSKLTSSPANDVFPIWSADRRHIAYSSVRGGKVGIYRILANGSGPEEELMLLDQPTNPLDWSRDDFLLYRRLDTTGYDLWAMKLTGDRTPFPIVQTASEDRDGQFSSDGRWLAYQSNQSGRSEIYVQSFPARTGRTTISVKGGAQVRWRADGREVFFIALDGRLMSVPVRVSADGSTVEADPPIELFQTKVGGALQSNYTQQYMVSPDGQRFLMNTVVDEAVSPITILLNWNPAR